MKSLTTAIQQRDAGTLRSMAGAAPKPQQEVPQEAIQVFNELFRQLKATFPAAMTNFQTQDDLNEFRRQWVLAFSENGIRTVEQINAGMRIARQQEKPFLPSPGQFVQWCKQADCIAVGLPDADELYGMVMKFSANRSMYRSAEAYPWANNACYWMVTKLYSVMRASGLTESELRKRCGQELAAMTARIRSGENIPAPRVMIPKMHIPVPKDKALAHIADIKAKFGFRTA
ncbi:MAG: replication protein P [Morganella sp. (in: enterobacteria)]